MAGKTAESDGVYQTASGAWLRVRKGSAIPDGAEIAGDAKPATGKRAKSKATENRAKPAADENRATDGETD